MDKKEGNYVIFYTCKKCDSKQSRSFTKNSYHNGVVLVRCDGCQNLHLIADNLGWFEEKGVNIEELAKRSGESLLKVDGQDEISLFLMSKIKEREQQQIEEK